MSPKVDRGSGGGTMTRSGWSRDVGRGASGGVTYSRRSYYYDREFSDSIAYLADGSGQQQARPGLRLAADYGDGNDEEKEVRRPFHDPFARGRVLQCASASGGGGWNAARHTSPEMLSRATTAASSRPEPVVDGDGRDDAQLVPRWIVFGADVFVRAVDLIEAYRRLRDGEENGGADLDPSHLEAGSSPGREISPRALVAAAAVGTRGQGLSGSGSGSGNASATRTREVSPLAAASRVCYYLVAAVVLGIAASFGVAVWWAQTRRDASAGFTIGGYVIAVDALVVAVVGMLHRPGCRCWKV